MGNNLGNPCLVGGIDPTDPNALDEWPNCAIPDCEFKCCTWSGTVYCAIHAEELLGPDEMGKRYDETHQYTRAEFKRRQPGVDPDTEP